MKVKRKVKPNARVARTEKELVEFELELWDGFKWLVWFQTLIGLALAVAMILLD